MLTAQYRQAAIDWLKGKQDFHEGLAILKKCGFKPGVVRRLESIGDTDMTRMHLKENIYLYIQFIGKDPEDTDADLGVIQGKQPEVLKQDEDKSMSIDELAVKVELSSAAPTGTSRAIIQYAKSYRLREKSHRAMAKIPETNSEVNVDARRKLSETIDYCTSQMEKLYPIVKDYIDSKKVISNEEFDQIMGEQKSEEEEKTEEASDDYDSLSKAELQKLLKSAKTKILRKRNLLEFQQETKAAAPNPLPDCPKRVKYEKEIANLEKEVEALQYAIARKV